MIQDLIITTVSYAVVFFGTMFLLHALTRGFLFKWMKVLAGRGKYILLQVKSPIQDYWVVAPIFGSVIKVKDREASDDKAVKTLNIPDNCIFKVFGVSCGYFDEKSNNLISIEGRQVSTFDPIKVSSFIARALMKPDNPEDQKRWKIQLIIYGALAGGLVICYVKLGNIEKIVSALKPVATVSGGVISGMFWFKIKK